MDESIRSANAGASNPSSRVIISCRAWLARRSAYRALIATIIKVSMHQKLNERVVDLDPQETAEWVEALDQVIDQAGPDRAAYLLDT